MKVMFFASPTSKHPIFTLETDAKRADLPRCIFLPKVSTPPDPAVWEGAVPKEYRMYFVDLKRRGNAEVVRYNWAGALASDIIMKYRNNQ